MTAVLVAQLWRKFICRACGLVYDEALGDADTGIAPGTRFDDLPDDWACPLCGVTKADFEPLDETPAIRTTAAGGGAVRHGGTLRRADAGVVIVGAGRAGWQMAAALRERDPTLAITVVAAGEAAVYDKPQLSVALSRGLSIEALVKEPAEAAARRLDVRLVAQTLALRVLPRERLLRTTRGTLRWRHLVLAHGAAPRTLPSLPASLCWRINDLDAYRCFREALGAAPGRVIVAGAGLVGCELANDLAAAGHAVTLLDVAERPLAGLLDSARSRQLLDAWRGLPLRFEGNVRIESTRRGPDGGLRVGTAGGRTFEADHVIAATGLETPTALAESAGLECHDGIVVDPVTLATRDPAIHALGDCVSFDGRPMRYIEPIVRQARHLADRITGVEPAPYSATAPRIRIKTSALPLTV